MLFIDASVIVAILTQKDDAAELTDRLGQYQGPFTFRRWCAWKPRYR